ncbi:hypothetical protein Q0M94_22795 (plasmid) [Deinococcus radiomollis]|uniref:hypothetical protein n=1 Tax=Deinococcus radiomollis TaxID=468916 RepID=UPI0038921ABA
MAHLSNPEELPGIEAKQLKKEANQRKALSLTKSHEKRRTDTLDLFIKGCTVLKEKKLPYTSKNLQVETAKIRESGKGISPGTLIRNLQVAALWAEFTGRKRVSASHNLSYVNLKRFRGNQIDSRAIRNFGKWGKGKLVDYLAVALNELIGLRQINAELNYHNSELEMLLLNEKQISKK